jgi:hypothetical protein
MLLYFDLDIAAFVSGPGTRDLLTALSVKRGDSLSLAVQFVSGTTPQELATGATGILGIKVAGDYDGDFIASAGSWTKTGTGTAALYTFTVSLNTTALAALLAGDTAALAASLELEYLVGTVRTSSQTIALTIYNDVVKGLEAGAVEVTGGTPVNFVAATATLDPAGANNNILVTAYNKGTAGNSVTCEILSPAANTAATLVTAVGNAIIITPGAKAQMVASGAGTAAANGPYLWVSGNTWAKSPHTLTKVGMEWRIIVTSSGAILYTSLADGTFPDMIAYAVTTGTANAPTIAALASSAVQVDTAAAGVLAVNLLAFVDNADIGTGAVAAVAATPLTGGVGTPGVLGAMKVASGFLYAVSALDGAGFPIWQKTALVAL